MKTTQEIQQIFEQATGFKPTVSKRVGSMKEYIRFKVNHRKFWDDYKNPKLKSVAEQIADGTAYSVFYDANSIDVKRNLISNL